MGPALFILAEGLTFLLTAWLSLLFRNERSGL